MMMGMASGSWTRRPAETRPGLGEGRGNLRQPRMRRAYHRQERIDGECDDRCRVADAKKWDEKAEHRDRWYCIKEINYAKRRYRRTLIAINENARRTADDDGNADRRARNPKVLDHQLQKERTALRHHRNYCMQQRHGIPLPYRIGITNQKMLILFRRFRRSMGKIDAPRRRGCVFFIPYHYRKYNVPYL